MATHIFTTFYMTSEIFYMRPHPTSFETFGITSEIVFTRKVYTETEAYGYVRLMKQDDIIEGSCAQPGWYGFFASDGDIVFWEDEFKSCTWDVSGTLVHFQKHLN